MHLTWVALGNHVRLAVPGEDKLKTEVSPTAFIFVGHIAEELVVVLTRQEEGRERGGEREREREREGGREGGWVGGREGGREVEETERNKLI